MEDGDVEVEFEMEIYKNNLNFFVIFTFNSLNFFPINISQKSSQVLKIFFLFSPSFLFLS